MKKKNRTFLFTYKDNNVVCLLNSLILAVPVFLVVTCTAVSGADTTWIKQFGSLGPVADRASSVDCKGNVYVVGYTNGTLPGQASMGSFDAFIRKYDSTGTELWTRQFGTIGADDSALSVAVDPIGNVYVVGHVAGTYALPGQTSAGGATDAFVRKYDSFGNEVWTRQFGTSGDDVASRVAVDSTDVYVVGFTSDTLPGQNNSGGKDTFVRKYDANGNEVWTRQFGTVSDDIATGATIDATGVYVTGETVGSLPGYTNAGNNDAFIRKYDLNGTEIWTRQFGTSGIDSTSGVAVDTTGVYVVGETSGTLPGQTRAGQSDAFIRKYDLNGNEVWTRQFGTVTFDFAKQVTIDATGVYVAGVTEGSLPGYPSAGSRDAFIRKYDLDGNEMWTRQFGTSGVDSAYGVAVDATGVYVVGETSGTFPGQTSAGLSDAFIRKFDINTGTEVWTRQFGGLGAASVEALAVATGENGYVYVAGRTHGVLPGQTSSGLTDAFICKYDLDGNVIWTRQFGTSGDDEALGIAVVYSLDILFPSGVYVVGATTGTLTGTYQQATNAGLTDAFIRKYSLNGNEIWTRQFGTSGFDSASGVATDDVGDVYVVGNVDVTLPGQTSAGGVDAFIRKYSRHNGAILWTRQFGSSGVDRANAVATFGSSVYVAGTTFGTLPGEHSAGNTDAFVREYSIDGSERWTRQFGTDGQDEARGIAKKPAGGMYVTGITYGSFPGYSNAGIHDVFVRRYEYFHDVWTRQFGTSGRDESRGVTWDSSGVYVVGTTSETLPNQSNMGGSDIFIRKYDIYDNEVWTKQFGTASADYVTAIAVNNKSLDYSNQISARSNNFMYVAGYTGGAFPGQINAGGNNAYIGKILKLEGSLKVRMGCPIYARIWKPLKIHVSLDNYDCDSSQRVTNVIIRIEGIGIKAFYIDQLVPPANCLTGQPGTKEFDITVINSVPFSFIFRNGIRLSIKAVTVSGETICCDECTIRIKLWPFP